MRIKIGLLIDQLREHILNSKSWDEPDKIGVELGKAESILDILKNDEVFGVLASAGNLERHLFFAKRNLEKCGNPDKDDDITDILGRDIPKIKEEIIEEADSIILVPLSNEVLSSIPNMVKVNYEEAVKCVENELLLAASVMLGRTIESAIDTICINQGIKTSFVNKNGKVIQWSIGSYIDWAEKNLDIPKNFIEDINEVKRSRHLAAHDQRGFYPSPERIQKLYGIVKETLGIIINRNFFN